jgi:hypothetical protein
LNSFEFKKFWTNTDSDIDFPFEGLEILTETKL